MLVSESEAPSGEPLSHHRGDMLSTIASTVFASSIAFCGFIIPIVEQGARRQESPELTCSTFAWMQGWASVRTRYGGLFGGIAAALSRTVIVASSGNVEVPGCGNSRHCKLGCVRTIPDHNVHVGLLLSYHTGRVCVCRSHGSLLVLFLSALLGFSITYATVLLGAKDTGGRERDYCSGCGDY